MIERLHQLRRWAGIDRAVFFSNAGQLLRLFTGPVTMLLVVKYLSPEVQGYFYAFSGILAMQIFLEMGFSQNILQFASHEFARLRFTAAQTVEGDPAAKSRLISLGRLSFGYYAAGALIFFLAVGTGGHIFFNASADHFSAGSFRSPAALAARLGRTNDPAAALVYDRLAPPTRQALKTDLTDKANQKALLAGLSGDLNNLLADASLSGRLAAAGVQLGPETLRLKAGHPAGAALARLNRLALADAFPQELPAGTVAWQAAWWIIVAAVAGSFAVQPAFMLLGGCNQVAATARFSFWSTLAAFGVNALGLVSGAGIYITAINSVFSLLLTVAYLLWRWRPFLSQFLESPAHGRVSWRHEIWPFQWRIAVSWAAGYFIFDIVNPVAFYFCGPVEAGRLGMSLQMTRMVYNVAMNWLHTRAPRFGSLIAQRAWAELDRLLRRSAAQAFGFGLLGMTAFVLAVPAAGRVLPHVSARLAPAGVNAWLAGGLLVMILTNAMAMELRAHKREPFMWYSVFNAAFSALFMLLFVRWWGITGEAAGYALGIWVVFPLACGIYARKRLEFRAAAPPPVP